MSYSETTHAPPNLRELLSQAAPRPGYTDASVNNVQWQINGHQWNPVRSSSGMVSTTTGVRRKPKRIRTAFTSKQMVELEQEYRRTRYLDRTRRLELSAQLDLNERTIKIWFQNRRMKEKKDKAEGVDTTYQNPPPSVLTSRSPIIISDQESEYQLPVSVNFNVQGLYNEWPAAPPPLVQNNDYGEPYSQNIPPQPFQYAYPTYSVHEIYPDVVGVDQQMAYNQNMSSTSAFMHGPLPNQNMYPIENVAPQDTNGAVEPVNTDSSWIRAICLETEFP